MDPKTLPIRKFQDEIVKAVQTNNVLVLIGETGSGKTTQLSQIVLESGVVKDGTVVGVTQPRRVAAVSVARRVAEEMGTHCGARVGYRVRFEDCTSNETKIKYLTDGTLLRETLDSHSLACYSVLILDEAHERSLNTDILFGLLKGLVKEREGTDNPLKLIITSATLDGDRFAQYYGSCPVFRVPGRTFPVEILHVDSMPKSYLDAALDCALDIHCHQPPGDILVFLTGQQEIDKAVRRINDEIRRLPAGSCGDLLVLPLYAAMPPEMQVRVFQPPPENCRRCIIATNIAETSITVNGVVYVIDPGHVKQKHYNPKTAMDSLDVVPISRVQATQRAGRAGRTQPGRCFRLYTKKYYENEMPETTKPEIQRTSLVSAVLYLKSLPLEIDVLAFDFLDRPERGQLEDALRQLYVLDGIDADGKITEIGKTMSHLPLDPSLSRALLAAADLGCVPEALTVAAMLSAEAIFLGDRGPELPPDARGDRPALPSGSKSYTTPKGRENLRRLCEEGLGDHVLLLRLFEAWAAAGFTKDAAGDMGLDFRGLRFARDVRRQLVGMAGEDGARLKTMIEEARGRRGGGGGGVQAAGVGVGVVDDDEDPGALDGDAGLPPVSTATTREQTTESGFRDREQPSKRPRWGDAEAPRPSPSPAPGAAPQAASVRERSASTVPGAGPGGVTPAATPPPPRGPEAGYQGFSKRTWELRQALTIGFANKIAKRMISHNGYRTMNEDRSQLAQVHPSSAPLAVDPDGLYPEWIIYHQLVSTGRVNLRQVCAIEGAWTDSILPRLQGVDVKRLSGGRSTAEAIEEAGRKAAGQGQGQAPGAPPPGAAPAPSAAAKKDDAAIEAARLRYLARKKGAQGGAGKR